MPNFPNRLRRTMIKKGVKQADITRATGITSSVLSRYLSGINSPTADNLCAIGKFLGVPAEWLQTGSDAPESIKGDQGIPSSERKQFQKIIEVQGALIDNLQKQIKEWEDWKATSKDRHAKGKAKADQAISKNKQKVGYLKKHKTKI